MCFKKLSAVNDKKDNIVDALAHKRFINFSLIGFSLLILLLAGPINYQPANVATRNLHQQCTHMITIHTQQYRMTSAIII